MVHREPKYIGMVMDSQVEKGDEIKVQLDNGQFFDGEVKYVDNPDHNDTVEVRIQDYGTGNTYFVAELDDGEWDVYAEKLTSDPSSPVRRVSNIDALYLPKQCELRDITVDELEEDDLDLGSMEVQQMIRELERIEDLMVKAEKGEITLRDYEVAIETMACRNGGRLAIDSI